MGKNSLSHGILFCKRSNDTQKQNPEGNEESDEKYVGEIKNGLPSGKGISTYPEWGKYIGQWKETFENGCILKDNLKMGKCMGLANTLWKMEDISIAHLKHGKF